MAIREEAVDAWVPEVQLGDRLRLVRRELGRRRGEPMTQGEMAELIGVTRLAYQQWEAGNNGPRDLMGVAARLSDATGVDIAWILGVLPVRTGVPVSRSISDGNLPTGVSPAGDENDRPHFGQGSSTSSFPTFFEWEESDSARPFRHLLAAPGIVRGGLDAVRGAVQHDQILVASR